MPVALILVSGMVSVFAGLLATGTEIDIFRFIQTGGVVAVLLVLIWTILTKRLIPGYVLKDSVAALEERLGESKEREKEWRDIALAGTGIVDRQTQVIERAAERIRQTAGPGP